MNTAALEQLLRSTRYNITQIDADLARMQVRTSEQFYHQGYQNGRKAELENLASLLEVALAAGEAART